MTTDPITMEIIRGALRSIILEMESLVERTAMSPMVKEKKDYFLGVYDCQGRILDAYLSLSGPGLVDPVLQAYPLEEMKPGDLYWYNDPHRTRGAIQHTGDMCFTAPVFFDGQVGAFAVAFGHFWDIGGSVPGSLSPTATEIFHEGTLVPPIRIYAGDRLNREAYAIVLNNSRFPHMLEGDTKALMASCRLADTRLQELAARYGSEVLLTAFDELIQRGIAAYRSFLRELLPEGEYASFDYVDADPVSGEPLRVDLKIRRLGERITADLTGSSRQARGPVNFITSPGAFNLMLARYLSYLNPDLPLNEGAAHIVDEVLVKPGTVTYPNFPAPVGLRSHTAIRLMGCITSALAQATAGRAPAGSPVYVIYNLRAMDSNDRYLYFSEGIGSGQGARPHADGLNAIYFRDQKNYPIEFMEREFPLRVERYAIRADSGGPGRYRGGCGVVRDIRILTDCTLSTRMDNVRFPCFGVNGGEAGAPGRFVLNPGTTQERVLPPAGENLPIRAGDLLRVETCGGGGWGDPYMRELQRVRQDVVEGFVSQEAAHEQYGVVLGPGHLEVDDRATQARRARPREPLPMLDRGPSAYQWLKGLGREG
ncbi:MAG: hydantoinase B/oxoprolinase family protein [Chloroflexi bacterium]|nr:hydantoinase B/oxoprolinase family protein [Chloroflexota bacterium]